MDTTDTTDTTPAADVADVKLIPDAEEIEALEALLQSASRLNVILDLEDLCRTQHWEYHYEDAVIASGWKADDGNQTVEYPTADSAEDAAEEYAEAFGAPPPSEGTYWVSIHTWREAVNIDGDTIRVDEETHHIERKPEEPECAEGGEHKWEAPHEVVGGIRENPGVWGNGGGVTIREVCRCGWSRLIDTWAQDLQSGIQGLRSVSYDRDYEDEIAAHYASEPDEDEDDDDTQWGTVVARPDLPDVGDVISDQLGDAWRVVELGRHSEPDRIRARCESVSWDDVEDEAVEAVFRPDA